MLKHNHRMDLSILNNFNYERVRRFILLGSPFIAAMRLTERNAHHIGLCDGTRSSVIDFH